MSARYTLLLALVLLALPAAAQNRLVDIDRIDAREVRAEGFVLTQPGEVHLDATVPVTSRHSYPLGDAWILDANTREVVWTLDTADGYTQDDHVRESDVTLALPAGAYEVYFASFPLRPEYEGNWNASSINDLGDIIREAIGDMFDGKSRWDSGYWREWNDWERIYDGQAGFGIRVEGRGERVTDVRRLAEPFAQSAVFTIAGLADDQYVQQGFEVAQPVEIDLYAIGEMRKNQYRNDYEDKRYAGERNDERFDFAWILDADTGERIWSMDYRNTEPAGGAEKNRVANAVLRLEPGRYAAIVVTDDSHAFGKWNAAPPYDPPFWGLTVLTTDPAARRNIRLFDYEHAPLDNAIVAFRQVRDDAYESKGFTLRRPLDVRIYAIGEGRGDDMYDYGWIEDARTGRRVWTMDYRDTERAGGGDKNRLFDDVIRLEAGSYVAHYVTDDSHAYRDWNDSPPYDQEAYGLTVIPVGTFDARDVTAYDPAEDPAVIARLAPVRDDEHKRVRFRLDRDANVHVMALGEGSDGHMYDYGWIEDARTGRVVWEMTYRMTEHGGGADKNRRLDVPVRLQAGEYEVHYVTDDSHAFGDWNSSPPYAPTAWGITIRRAE